MDNELVEQLRKFLLFLLLLLSSIVISTIKQRINPLLHVYVGFHTANVREWSCDMHVQVCGHLWRLLLEWCNNGHLDRNGVCSKMHTYYGYTLYHLLCVLKENIDLLLNRTA